MTVKEVNSMNVFTKLLKIQTELKAPKNKFSKFGAYYYRSLEGILEAVKPLLSEVGAVVLLSDKVEEKAGRWYIVASAAFVDAETGERIEVEARARETAVRAKFDDAQLTGAASSYARKYALSGLFGVDDGADVDGLPDAEGVGGGAGKKKGGKNAGASQPASASSAPTEQQTRKPAPEPQQEQAESVEMINAVQCQLLEKTAERKGVQIESILQRFSISGLGQLSEKNYRVLMGELQRGGAGK